ncbi:MAG: hypothetical protein ABJA02_12540 [Acidobacteriota bacterium]
MIKHTAKFILASSLIVLGGFTATQAQMYSDTVLKVKIPNAFVLRDKTYPAGDYTFKPTDDATDSPYLLEIVGPDRSVAFFDTIGTTVDNAPKDTEIVFNKIGDQYFLSQIWVKGETNGNEVVETSAEKGLVASGEPMAVFTVNEVNKSAKDLKERVTE